MMDNFQSKPAVKLPRSAKTVEVKSSKNSAELTSTASINETAISFIRAWKKSQAKQQ
jgi:hypothetical protein